MKPSIFIVMLFLMTTGMAQDPYLQEADAAAEKMAKAISEPYVGELGLSSDQRLQFEAKVTEFVLRKRDIQAVEESDSDKLALLQRLSNQETAEMGTILTRPQLRKYKRLKTKVQPVVLVVGEVEE